MSEPMVPKPRLPLTALIPSAGVATSVISARQRGFTLIELIMVIVLLAILSFGTSQFIVNSSQSYVDTARRERQGSAARAAVEKISRELRNALPNSVRVVDLDGSLSADNQGDCIEFVPVLGDSVYTRLPLDSPAATFRSVPFIVGSAPAVSSARGTFSRVAVNPISAADIYRLSASSAISSVVDPVSVLEGSAEVNVLLQAPHRFPLGSAGRRWFMVTDPVSFCIDAEGKLFRYGDYGYISTPQPTPGNFADAVNEQVPQRALLAIGARGSFAALPATPQRHALVQLRLAIRERGEGVAIDHEVHLRHVP